MGRMTVVSFEDLTGRHSGARLSTIDEATLPRRRGRRCGLRNTNDDFLFTSTSVWPFNADARRSNVCGYSRAGPHGPDEGRRLTFL